MGARVSLRARRRAVERATVRPCASRSHSMRTLPCATDRVRVVVIVMVMVMVRVRVRVRVRVS